MDCYDPYDRGHGAVGPCRTCGHYTLETRMQDGLCGDCAAAVERRRAFWRETITWAVQFLLFAVAAVALLVAAFGWRAIGGGG